MPDTVHHVVFEPDGRTVAVPDGQTLLEAARAAGIHLNAPCGGVGTCGGCRVVIPDGPPEPSEACRRVLSGEEIGRCLRLACQVRVRGALRVVVPEETRLADQAILTDGAAADVPLAPAARKVTVRLPEPSVADQRADADRLLDALAEAGETDLRLGLKLLRHLPDRLRSLEWHATCALVGDEVIDVERPTTREACYGLAVDVGTTTLAGYLVDLATGAVVAVAGRTNPQTAYGDDVVARIAYAGRERDGLRTLHGLVIDALNEMLAELCRKAHVRRSAVYEAAIVGNTTMAHLVLRLPVDAVGRAPFIPAGAGGRSVAARDVGLKMHPGGRVYVAPLVGGFVGADTVAVVLAAGLHQSDGLRLLVDIGTNGEIVLGGRDRLLACSAAAGPAFEGARIRYGMRAAPGAIDRVDVSPGDDLALRTLGDAPPVGLCGTGLIDAVAALLHAGVLAATGALRTAADLADRPALAARLIGADGDRAVVLAPEAASGARHPILLTQRDVREVQLAKGAIAAGIETLLAERGATAADLDEVILAGAFGNVIRPARAQALGLFPAVPPDRLRFVGNAAGAGARALLTSAPLRRVAEDVARGIEHVELSRRPDFQARFAEAMLFPPRRD